MFFILMLYTMLYTVRMLLTVAVTSPGGPETRGASVGEETEKLNSCPLLWKCRVVQLAALGNQLRVS